jgi:hypothetical protein
MKRSASLVMAAAFLLALVAGCGPVASPIVQRLQAKIVIPAHRDPNLTDDLTVLLGESEHIPTGELVVTRTDLSGLQTPKVVSLDMP